MQNDVFPENDVSCVGSGGGCRVFVPPLDPIMRASLMATAAMAAAPKSEPEWVRQSRALAAATARPPAGAAAGHHISVDACSTAVDHEALCGSCCSCGCEPPSFPPPRRAWTCPSPVHAADARHHAKIQFPAALDRTHPNEEGAQQHQEIVFQRL